MKPITILVGALGGDGGGVLCDWIVIAAQSQGLGVQATQIPGVAQRTGATTYYLEVMPRRPPSTVLALNPAIGEVDVAFASELLEAGRMIFNGFVTPDRTTLIASTHRVLAIGERSAMGDGSFDVGRLLRAVKERSRRQILFDMDQAAEEAGSVINAVLLGALAGSGRLPIPDAAFKTAIRHGGKAVDTNLAAFAFGRGHARGELAQVVREHRKRQAGAQGIEDLLARARRSYPAVTLDVVEEGMRRLTVYQHRWYAEWYLNRLDTVHALGSTELLRETARHLAVRMSFEDVIRVAQAKTSPSGWPACAPKCGPRTASRWRSPSISSLASRRSPRSCRQPGPNGFWPGASAPDGWARPTSPCICARPPYSASFACAWWPACAPTGRVPTASSRSRPRSTAGWRRYAAAGRTNVDLAREIAECARLIKGYGDTYKRGLANYRRITAEVIEPALVWRMTPRAAVDAVASARVAALADPEGETLSKTLAAIAAAAPVLRHAAE